jgi:NAD(P)-dependent dehydrogenase (short-subunit alcohol dehydrogenase family)
MGSKARLSERVAIVTGGSSGIGRATAVELAREEAQVVVVGRDSSRLRETLSEIETIVGATALAVEADVRSALDMERMAKSAVERFGRIDILVAAAGVLRTPGLGLKTLAQTPVEAWDEIVRTNLTGTFLSIRAVLPYLLAQKSGDIVTVSSKGGRKGVAFDAPYCASKFGVLGLTESLAEEVRARGVRVQAVVPGNFDTPVWKQNGPFARPANLPPPERVAVLIVEMLALPGDCFLPAPLAEPARVPSRPIWLSRGAPAAAAVESAGVP